MAILKKTNKNKKNKRRPNWLLRFTIVIVAVPCLILAFVLLTSMGSSSQPVVGDRFKGQLDPKIEESKLKDIEGLLGYAEAEDVEVNLKSATLRITINTKDETTNEQIAAIVNDAYAKVDSILPIATYFTNKENTKMYDLEIQVYNYLPDEARPTNIHYVLVKNASAESQHTDIVSNAKNQEVADKLKSYPKKGEEIGQ
ncbi:MULTISPECIES: hypothetical protein [Breznakia]|uniref:Uncharacterized protein n=1 Tax=Breznakia blatticola TaxID=1754012 RepID=A0A4R7ZTI3_9FIRM|nr:MULTISPECIES: hypothetical protein [Breznakia]MDH6366421.1 hypothetical protein [Breznakia sp. PH1-1]MDH6403514.1 hypothetical protein [Breznakia sp. PF1-11]MDH6411223.1 hypothetical protein [Breznakia sp. PFB1-11]MDH6413514.1 hypothetical protein [Breznakia sp. PFB1-14]MDH6415768.1 hypothetical protein [Breznakia sp. PFB1-4]